MSTAQPEPSEAPPPAPSPAPSPAPPAPSPAIDPPRPRRSVVQLLFTWGLPVFIAVIVFAFRQVLLPFILGLMVAYLLAPPVGAIARLRIGRRRVHRAVGVIVVYTGIAAVIAMFFLWFMPHVSGDFARLFRETPRLLQRVRNEWLPKADAWVEERLDVKIKEEPPPSRKLIVTELKPGRYEINLDQLELEIDPAGKGRYVIGPRNDADEPKGRLSDLLRSFTRSTESEMRDVLAVGQRFVRSIVRGFAWFVLTFMVAAYLLIDPQRVTGFFRSMAPPHRRSDFDELLAEIDRGLSGVIRGQLLICVVNGVLTTIGLVIFDVKYALLLGLVAAVMSFIPVFGSILSSVPIVAIAIASGPDGPSVSAGIEVLAWIIGIHFLEANLFNPKIIGDAAKIHPVVVVFALLVGEEVGGLAGALVAVPAASIVQALFAWSRRRASHLGGDLPVPPRSAKPREAPPAARGPREKIGDD